MRNFIIFLLCLIFVMSMGYMFYIGIQNFDAVLSPKQKVIAYWKPWVAMVISALLLLNYKK